MPEEDVFPQTFHVKILKRTEGDQQELSVRFHPCKSTQKNIELSGMGG